MAYLIKIIFVCIILFYRCHAGCKDLLPIAETVDDVYIR